MKFNPHVRNRDAFTLVEMVGVLAVIATLAAMLVPKIFSAINEARLVSTVGSINSVKTATVGYFGKYGRFGGVGGTSLATNFLGHWDLVLLTESFLERPFETKIAENCDIVLETSTASLTYSLDGANPLQAGFTLVSAYLTNVDVVDAIELSRRFDGMSLTETNSASPDHKGRIDYNAASSGKVGFVRIYLGHK